MDITIDQALQKGVAAHREGKLQDAERLYRSILRIQPAHADANHNLGVLAVSVDQANKALPLFKTALETNPKIDQFWLSYIDALIKEKHYVAAEKIILEAKKHHVAKDKIEFLELLLPPKTRAQNESDISPPEKQLNKLLEYYRNGNLTAAERLSVSITEEYPDHQFAWKILSAILGALGKKAEAANASQTAVELCPQDAEAHSNLGVAMERLGRLEEAEASYSQAVALQPELAEAHLNLGNALQGLGRFSEAEQSYTQAIALKPKYTEAHGQLANLLNKSGKLLEAETIYRRTIALEPSLAGAHLNLGNTLQELGRLDEAKDCFIEAVTHEPDFAEAHRHLAAIKNFSQQDEQFSKMVELYRDEAITENQRCHINFGLAKAHEDLEDFAQAFVHYEEGNKTRRKLLNYDFEKDRELFKRIKNSYPQIADNSLGSDRLVKSHVPIFIVGLMRSGTTLVEQIISSHSDVTGAGELPFVTKFGREIATGLAVASRELLVEFRTKYLEELASVSEGNIFVIDKNPLNFLYLGLLVATFPEAKIIHVRRNPAAVCWANYKQYFVSANLDYCYSLDDISAYHGLYRDLFKLWDKSFGRRIFNLDYEVLTTNQEMKTRNLIDYLNLNWEEQCLSPQENARSVATLSNIQVRKEVYQGSSNEWEKYRPFLNGKLDDLAHDE
jgi:tetratricopeptide (TPR) repeat protein